MGASFKVDVTRLIDFSEKIKDPALMAALNRIPQERAIAALVGQAIAENFSQEGPGWAPLKAETIRRSVAKGIQRKLARITDVELLKQEQSARKKGAAVKPHRKILDRSGVLRGSVTTPGAKGNIYLTEGTNIVWGSNLIYAGVHNNGNPTKGIPKREYLKIKDAWMKEIYEYTLERYLDVIMGKFGGSL